MDFDKTQDLTLLKKGLAMNPDSEYCRNRDVGSLEGGDLGIEPFSVTRPEIIQFIRRSLSSGNARDITLIRVNWEEMSKDAVEINHVTCQIPLFPPIYTKPIDVRSAFQNVVEQLVKYSGPSTEIILGNPDLRGIEHIFCELALATFRDDNHRYTNTIDVLVHCISDVYPGDRHLLVTINHYKKENVSRVNMITQFTKDEAVLQTRH